MANFVVKIQGLKQLQANFRKAPVEVFKGLTTAINKSAFVITQNVKGVTPVKTSTLRTGIRPEFGPLRAVIRPHNAPYAIFVHEGTRPYTIRPKAKKALWWKGAAHPVRSVRHPGIKKNPFMEKGLEKSLKQVDAIFKNEVDKILTKIAKK